MRKKITYTRDYFIKKGRKGGKATLATKGVEFYKLISKKGVKARKQNGKVS